jgi:hypothetical protein
MHNKYRIKFIRKLRTVTTITKWKRICGFTAELNEDQVRGAEGISFLHAKMHVHNNLLQVSESLLCNTQYLSVWMSACWNSAKITNTISYFTFKNQSLKLKHNDQKE